jgi:putative ABC transport system substrate-binding protein
MRRRELITLLGGASFFRSKIALAETSQKVRRIGVLLGLAEGQEAASRIRALRLGLRDLGWNDGRNIAIECRYGASDLGLISRYANELVGLAPDAIVGNSTPVLAALRRATSSIPIVFSS